MVWQPWFLHFCGKIKAIIREKKNRKEKWKKQGSSRATLNKFKLSAEVTLQYTEMREPLVNVDLRMVPAISY